MFFHVFCISSLWKRGKIYDFRIKYFISRTYLNTVSGLKKKTMYEIYECVSIYVLGRAFTVLTYLPGLPVTSPPGHHPSSRDHHFTDPHSIDHHSTDHQRPDHQSTDHSPDRNAQKDDDCHFKNTEIALPISFSLELPSYVMIGGHKFNIKLQMPVVSQGKWIEYFKQWLLIFDWWPRKINEYSTSFREWWTSSYIQENNVTLMTRKNKLPIPFLVSQKRHTDFHAPLRVVFLIFSQSLVSFHILKQFYLYGSQPLL